jgi:hypothetical protein
VTQGIQYVFLSRRLHLVLSEHVSDATVLLRAVPTRTDSLATPGVSHASAGWWWKVNAIPV